MDAATASTDRAPGVAGKVIIVTGASTGIGAATAKAAHRAGAHVVLMARRTDRLQQLASGLLTPDRPAPMVLPGDLTDPTYRAAAVAAVLDQHGRVDVLVNNAGRGGYGPVADIDAGHLQAMWELNVQVPLAMMQAVIPAMRTQGGGVIINVSSGAAEAPYPFTGAYSSTKAALSHLGAVARAELAPDEIVVSTLLPYLTVTDFDENLLSGDPVQAPPSAPAHTAESVAQAVLNLIVSREPRLSLVPA